MRYGWIYGAELGWSEAVHALDNQANVYRFNFPHPVYVNPAKKYVIEVSNGSDGPGTDSFMWSQGAGNAYALGRPIIDSIPDNPDYSTSDFLFTTGRRTNTGPATSGNIGPFAYRGIVDADDDGDGDSFQAAHFVARRETPNITDENRTVFEFDVDRYFGAGSATISGTLHVNNTTDTGERIVRLDVYGGDGLITVSDFEIPATTAPASFSYHPPNDIRVDFNIDITDQLNALLESGEDFLGVRFRPATIRHHRSLPGMAYPG